MTQQKFFVQRITRLLSSLSKSTLTFKIGFFILLSLVTLAVLEPYINNYLLRGHSSTEIGLFPKLLPPSLEHPLGTDHFGRDIFSLQLTGLRYSLIIGLLAGGIATLIAVVIATTSGYLGGKVDSALNAMTNSVLVIPTLPILLAIAAYIRMDLLMMSFTLSIFSWPWPTRVIRAQILSLKERPYIDLAKVSGLNSVEIMFFEILPNLMPFIGVGFANAVIGAMIAETGLRLIGLGPGDIPSLGLLLFWSMGFGAIAQGYYQLVLAPAILLILIFISLNLVNIGLEDMFNPRLKRITGL
ncbi:ABC transporter permease [Candidatus Bathyarchaeota archaeon]|nr:ABC transporter permease [Candidatus Bathyarchaeota archaeon]